MSLENILFFHTADQLTLSSYDMSHRIRESASCLNYYGSVALEGRRPS